MFLLVLVIVTVSFFLKRQALHKERARKINDYLKSFHQLNNSLKTATQTLYDILSVVENEVHIGISERVNLLENHIEILNNCINHLNMISGNSVVHDIRKTCLDSKFVLEQAVKKTLGQLFNMNFIEHDLRDYFLKITEYRLNLIRLEKEFNKGNH
ncbi:hypothetical protein ABLO26_24965 [Neobacillus sp. 179-J 1A1 HS]|uniref:hypothetical protein n=1 Tax=Neobacillus driksii TaxID=3035913 RepID=UPI0035BC19C6